MRTVNHYELTNQTHRFFWHYLLNKHAFLSFQHRKLERDYEDALGNLKAERKACKAAEEGKADAERRVTELTNINAQLEASIKIRVREFNCDMGNVLKLKISICWFLIKYSLVIWI